MRSCSICKKVEVAPGRLNDYKKLACYHYREASVAGILPAERGRDALDTSRRGGGLGPFAAIYALRLAGRLKWRADTDCAGVIVYKMPDANVELRSVATGGLFADLDRNTQLALVNSNIRRIARVIVDPMFRGLGLAARLVRETMPLMNVPIIEALAVMGLVNPFFEKAGMQSYKAKTPLRSIRLIEDLRSVRILPPAQRVRPAERSRVSRVPIGIPCGTSPQIPPGTPAQAARGACGGVRGTCPRTEGGTPSTPSGAAEEDRCLLSPRKVHDAIGRLDEDAGRLIEREMSLFLQSYGSRRRMPPSLERTRYVLSKLTDRPAYYIWFNPNMELRI